MKMTIIPAATAVQATKQEVNTHGYESVVFSASGLAGAEEVDIWIESGGAWIAATDEAGAVIVLTATKTNRALMAGLRYAVTKDATVAAVAVEADLIHHRGRG